MAHGIFGPRDDLPDLELALAVDFALGTDFAADLAGLSEVAVAIDADPLAAESGRFSTLTEVRNGERPPKVYGARYDAFLASCLVRSLSSAALCASFLWRCSSRTLESWTSGSSNRGFGSLTNSLASASIPVSTRSYRLDFGSSISSKMSSEIPSRASNSSSKAVTRSSSSSSSIVCLNSGTGVDWRDGVARRAETDWREGVAWREDSVWRAGAAWRAETAWRDGAVWWRTDLDSNENLESLEATDGRSTGSSGIGSSKVGSAGVGLTGVGRAGAGLTDVGRDEADLDKPDLDGAGFVWAGCDGAGLDAAGLDGAGLDATGLDATGLTGVGLEIERLLAGRGTGLDGAGLTGVGRAVVDLSGSVLTGVGRAGAGLKSKLLAAPVGAKSINLPRFAGFLIVDTFFSVFGLAVGAFSSV